MSITIATPGKLVGDNDTLKGFLKVFGTEVMAAYSLESLTVGHTFTRNITAGKAANFPVMGRAKAKYLKRGDSLDAQRTNIEHNEKTIVIDGLLTADCLVFDLDDMMAHFEVKSNYTSELGKSLALAKDCAVWAEIAKLAMSTNANIPDNAVTGVKGTGVGAVYTKELAAAKIGETPEMGEAVAQLLLKIKTAMSNNKVPKDGRICYIKPQALNALIANKDIINKLYGAVLTIEGQEPPKMFGFTLIESPDLTEGGADNGNVIQGSGHVFPAAYKDSCVLLVCHDTTIGELTLGNLAIEHARRTDYQADEIVAKYAKGFDGLRPEAAFMGCISEEAPTQSTISPTTATVSKASAADTAFTVTFGTAGEALSYVKNGDATLTAGTDYTYSSGTLTIKSAYLAALSAGTTTLKVKGNTVGDGEMTITFTITE